MEENKTNSNSIFDFFKDAVKEMTKPVETLPVPAKPEELSMENKAMYIYLNDMEKSGKNASEIMLSNNDVLTIARTKKPPIGFSFYQNGEEIAPDKAAKLLNAEMGLDLFKKGQLKDAGDLKSEIEKEYNQVISDKKLAEKGEVSPADRSKSIDFFAEINKLVDGQAR